MRFWRAIGLGILFLVLAISMPRVFREIEETILVVLDTVQTILRTAESLTASPAPLLPKLR